MQISRQLTTVVLMGILLAVAGCKNVPTRNDQQIESDIQTKLAADNSLQGQSIVPAVDHGVATLTGAVNTSDARTLAGSDAGSIAGVRTVVNDLTLPTEQAAVAPSCGCPAPVAVHVHRKHFRKHPELIAQNEEPIPPAPPAAAPEPMPAPAPAHVITVVRPVPVVVVPPPVYYPRPYYAWGPAIGVWGRPGPWVHPGYRLYGRPYFYGRR